MNTRLRLAVLLTANTRHNDLCNGQQDVHESVAHLVMCLEREVQAPWFSDMFGVRITYRRTCLDCQEDALHASDEAGVSGDGSERDRDRSGGG